MGHICSLTNYALLIMQWRLFNEIIMRCKINAPFIKLSKLYAFYCILGDLFSYFVTDITSLLTDVLIAYCFFDWHNSREQNMDLFKLQQALCPVSDPKSEVNECFGIIDTEQGNSNNNNVKVVEEKVEMSAQRRRRAERMAKRPQRLALGPVSDHAAEIAEAMRLVEAKARATSEPEQEDIGCPISQTSLSAEINGSIQARVNKEASAVDVTKVVSSTEGQTAKDEAINPAKASPSAEFNTDVSNPATVMTLMMVVMMK